MLMLYTKGKQYGRRISECLSKYSPDVVVACSPLSAKYVIADGRCQVPVVLMDHDDCNISMPLLSRENFKQWENVNLYKSCYILLCQLLKSTCQMSPSM